MELHGQNPWFSVFTPLRSLSYEGLSTHKYNVLVYFKFSDIPRSPETFEGRRVDKTPGSRSFIILSKS